MGDRHDIQPALLLTPRCSVAAFEEADCEAARELFSSARTREFLGGPVPEADLAERTAQYLKAEKELAWSVRLLDGTFIGLITVGPYHETGQWELSYQFLPEFWGDGLAYETISALLPDVLPAHPQLVAETQSANLRSRRLLDRLGFVLQGQGLRYHAEQSVYAYAGTPQL